MCETNDPPKRFAWYTKTVPDTGKVMRFCRRCQDFLPLERFYPSSIRDGTLSCKTHCSQRTAPYRRSWHKKNRGEPGSVQRVRSNLNNWIAKQKLPGWKKWSDCDVLRALTQHSIDLALESRKIRFRPLDRSKTFTPENSILKFQKG